MALQARLEAFATRVAGEFKSVRLAIASLPTVATIDARISAVVGAAPAALDTLAELAVALQSEQSATATITNSLSNKIDASAIGNPEVNLASIFEAALL